MKSPVNLEQEIIDYQQDALGFREKPRVDKIVKAVYEGRCCSILGPLFSHKSVLLNHVQMEIERALRRATILISVKEIINNLVNNYYEPADFLRVFAITLAKKLQEKFSIDLSGQAEAVNSDYLLKNFLLLCPRAIGQDLVLLIDQLESAQVISVESLLKVLRSAYSEQQVKGLNNFVVVIASSLRIASLSLGASSPFNIAEPFWVSDLTREDSFRWIKHLAENYRIQITDEAGQRLFKEAGGDRFLLRTLFLYCRKITHEENYIGIEEVKKAVKWFNEKEVDSYPPLQATLREIEGNPSLLIGITEILKDNNRSRKRTSEPNLSKIDELTLSGAVISAPNNIGQNYRIRNEIYKKFLRKYFKPHVVSNLLKNNGKWNEAINYLVNFPEERNYLEGIVCEAIKFSPDLKQASKYLFEYIKTAYSPVKLATYYLDKNQQLLLSYHTGFSDSESFILKKLGEVAIHHPKNLFLTKESINENGISYQLIDFWGINNEQVEVMIVRLLISDFDDENSITIFESLLRFIEQTRNCFEEPFKNTQLFITYNKNSAIFDQASGLLNPSSYLSAIIESAIEVVPNAEKGSLYLWDEASEKLIIQAQKKFSEHLVNNVKLNPGEGYAGWVYQTEQPLILNNVWEDERTRELGGQEVRELRAAICVPLIVWGKSLGVLCLDSNDQNKCFDEHDLVTLLAFASHASQVIYSHMLRQEFYDLGLEINRSDVNEERVFDRAASSIFKLFPVIAVNMLLLEVNEQFGKGLELRPIEVFHKGLKLIRSTLKIRHNGLTANVLKTKSTVKVSSPNEPPGINPEAFKLGIRSTIALPIKFEEEVLGTFYVHYGEIHTFTEAEERILSLFVNQVALAISNLMQRRELVLTDKVAWMGIILPDKAHELTQDLLPIKSAVSILKIRGPQSGPALQHLNTISNYLEKALGNLRDIVKYPYIHQPELVNVVEYLHSSIQELLKADRKVDLKFEHEIENNIFIRVDKRWFLIVLKNLVRNASRAMIDANEKSLKVAYRIDADRVKISLTNTGKKIPEQIFKYCFKEPIPDDKKNNDSGAGIGLLIVSRIIRRYEGKIWIAENEDGRVTITLSLPYELNNSKD